MIISRYQGVILDNKPKYRLDWGIALTEDKCLNLYEKWYLKENMVGTMIEKGQIPDII